MDTNQNPFTSLSEPDATLFALYLRHHDSPESFASKANFPLLEALKWLGQPIIEACLNYITKREHTLLTFDALQIRRSTLNASLDLTAQLRGVTPPLPPLPTNPTPTSEPPKELQAISLHTAPDRPQIGPQTGSQSSLEDHPLNIPINTTQGSPQNNPQDVALHTQNALQNRLPAVPLHTPLTKPQIGLQTSPQNSPQDIALHTQLAPQNNPQDVPLPTQLNPPLTQQVSLQNITPPYPSTPKIPTPYIPNPKAVREFHTHASLLLRTLATTARLLSSGFKLPALSPLSPTSTPRNREPKTKLPTSHPSPTPSPTAAEPTSPLSPTPPTPDFQLPPNMAPPGYVPRKPDRIVYGCEVYEATGPLPPGSPPRYEPYFPTPIDEPIAAESSP